MNNFRFVTRLSPPYTLDVDLGEIGALTDTVGNMIAGGATGWEAVTGNATATKKFLSQTGTGTASVKPSWETITNSDLPSALTGKTVNALTLTAQATGFTVAGGTTSKTLTVELDSTINQDLSTDSAVAQFAALTLANNGLHLLGGGLSPVYDLILKPGSSFASVDRTLTITTGDADRTFTLSGDLNVEGASNINQDLTTDSTAAAFAALTLTNTGLHILDTNASHDLIIAPGSDLSTDRTLTITTGDAARTFTLSGDLNVEGASNINQDLTTDSTAAAFVALTLANNGLHLLGGGLSPVYDLILKPGSSFASVDRTLTITTGDADRTFTLSGNLNVEAASNINQDLSTDSSTAQLGKLGLGAAVGTALLYGGSANDAWILSGKSSGGVETNILKLNTSNQIELGAPLLSGPLWAGTNWSTLTLIDGSITDANAHYYDFSSDGVTLLRFSSKAAPAGDNVFVNPQVDLQFSTGIGLRTGTTGTNTFLLKAYNTGGTWTTFDEFTADATSTRHGHATRWGAGAAHSDTYPLLAGNATDYLAVTTDGDLLFVDADGTASITGPAGGGLQLKAGIASTTGLQLLDNSSLAMLTLDTSAASGPRIIAHVDLVAGPFLAEQDSGLVLLANMPVSSAAGAATEESLGIAVDSVIIGKAFAESDGSGGIQNHQWRGIYAGVETTSVKRGLAARHTTSGTPAAGFGAGLEFQAQTKALDANFEIGAAIDAISTDVTGGSEDFDLIFSLMAGGATAAERLRVASDGVITAYAGAGIITGTNGDFYLAPNGSGTLILGASSTSETTAINELAAYTKVRKDMGFAFAQDDVQSMSDDGSIACASVYCRIVGNGGAVTLDTDPAIAVGTHAGQIIIIEGTNDTNTVTIADGCNCQLAGGANWVGGLNDTLTMIWNGTDWLEIARSNN